MIDEQSPFEFDAAISFLSRDLAAVEDLASRLKPDLNVFVFSRNQEQVVATDGMTSYREMFREKARLSIVWYRHGWGGTPWTAVEEVAIGDRCRNTKYRSLILVNVDGSETPSWVPDREIYFDLRKYPVEQLVGIIKARAQELGAVVAPISPADLARRHMEEAAYADETSSLLRTYEGIQAADACAAAAFEHLIGSVGQYANVALGWIPKAGRDQMSAVARLGNASVQLLRQRTYANMTKGALLRLRSFSGGLAIPGASEMNAFELRELGGEQFELIRIPAMGWCWKLTGSREAPMRPEDVGDRAALRLVELAASLRPK